MVKGTRVKVHAPVMNIPDNTGKDTPVMMDMYMWSDMMNYITDKKLKIITDYLFLGCGTIDTSILLMKFLKLKKIVCRLWCYSYTMPRTWCRTVL